MSRQNPKNNIRWTMGSTSTSNPTPAMEEIMGRLNSSIPTPAMTAIIKRQRDKSSSSPQEFIPRGSWTPKSTYSSSKQQEESEEESEGDEEESRTPSRRHQTGSSRDNSKIDDPFVTPRQYNSPSGSTYSTTANFGSPSFQHHDSGDESHVDLKSHNQNSHILQKHLMIGLIMGGIAVLIYFKAKDHNGMPSDLTLALTCPLNYSELMAFGFEFNSRTCAVFGLLLIIFGLGLYKMLMFIKRRKQRKEMEFFDLIESIISLLKQQYERNEVWAINHIRDEMFNVRERKEKEALWNNAVNYISNCESRVRTEIQSIAGEEFRVWRWLPSTSPLSKRMSSSGPSTPSRLGQSSSSTPGRLYPNLSGVEIGHDFDDY